METSRGVNVWKDPFFKSLSMRGRLAYLYIKSFEDLGEEVIFEDMAVACDMTDKEARDYYLGFKSEGEL